MSSIGYQFGDLAALFGGEGEAPPDSAAPESGNDEVEGPQGQAPAGDGLRGGADAADGGLPGEVGVADGHFAGSDAASAGATFESTLIATICELNGMSGDDFDLDADLTTDLDMQGLPLWALVAELERFAGAKFPDPVVEAWQTPRDILDAPRGQA